MHIRHCSGIAAIISSHLSRDFLCLFGLLFVVYSPSTSVIVCRVVIAVGRSEGSESETERQNYLSHTTP